MARPTSERAFCRSVVEEEVVGSGDDDSDDSGEEEMEVNVRRRVSWSAVEHGVEGSRRASVFDTEEEQWADLLRGSSAQKPRRSSFCGVRREYRARDAWLDRAWELKKSWYQRKNDANTQDSSSSSSCHHAAMDMDEVRACRDLGLELPSDCTVEIQCYGTLSSSDRSHRAADSSSDTGEDPVKARLREWAQAVALASTAR